MQRIIMFTLLLINVVILCSCNNSNSETPAKSYAINTLSENDTVGARVYLSSNNGETWENRSNGLPADIVITDLFSSRDLLILSTKRSGIFIYDPESDLWKTTPTNPVPDKDIDAAGVFNNIIYAGTGGAGVFLSTDNGRTWIDNNDGLGNLIIRRFSFIKDKLFAGTNGGLYSFDYTINEWKYEFGNDRQVNGIIESGDDIYAGTNHGIFKYSDETKEWSLINTNLSLHNISSAGNIVYALAYNELFYSSDKGETWQSGQQGLPDGLYTFQIKQKDDILFAGQWDGVYTKSGSGKWSRSSEGMPPNFAVTELSVFNNIIAAGGSEGKARK